MSIAPPSDIILDVAQAADPRRLQAATVKLNSMATASGGTAADFHTLLANAAGPSSGTGGKAGSTLSSLSPPTTRPSMSPYQKFEAVLLQTFVQEMLPKDDKLYGDAATADAYRSMMAEQLANQMTKSGRIGIAKMIEKAHGPQTATAAGSVVGASSRHDLPQVASALATLATARKVVGS
ncbi:MAG: rod-binding protein [Janthinobacterium lividum]